MGFSQYALRKTVASGCLGCVGSPTCAKTSGQESSGIEGRYTMQSKTSWSATLSRVRLRRSHLSWTRFRAEHSSRLASTSCHRDRMLLLVIRIDWSSLDPTGSFGFRRRFQPKQAGTVSRSLFERPEVREASHGLADETR